MERRSGGRLRRLGRHRDRPGPVVRPARSAQAWRPASRLPRGSRKGEGERLFGRCATVQRWLAGGVVCPISTSLSFSRRAWKDGSSAATSRFRRHRSDRKSVVWGKGVSVRVDLGGGRVIKKKKN